MQTRNIRCEVLLGSFWPKEHTEGILRPSVESLLWMILQTSMNLDGECNEFKKAYSTRQLDVVLQ